MAAVEAAVESVELDSLDSSKQQPTSENRHLHRCQNCGTLWGHGNMLAGDIEAHKCPKCGRQEWRVYSGGKSHSARPSQPGATRSTGVWDYFRAVLPIALLSAALVLLSISLLEWFDGKTKT